MDLSYVATNRMEDPYTRGVKMYRYIFLMYITVFDNIPGTPVQIPAYQHFSIDKYLDSQTSRCLKLAVADMKK